MGIFKQRKPRGFQHQYIYVDERRERLKEMEERAKRELGMLSEKVPTTEAVSKKPAGKDNMDEANSVVDEVLQSLQRYQEDTEEIVIDAPENSSLVLPDQLPINALSG